MKISGIIILSELPTEKMRLTEKQMDHAVALVADDLEMQAWFALYQQPVGRRHWVFSFTFDHPSLRPMLELIRESTGRTPTPWKLYKNQQDTGEHFFVTLRRKYGPADLDEAPLLALFGTHWLAKMAPRDNSGPLLVIGNKLLENPKAFGRLDPYVVRGMNSGLME